MIPEPQLTERLAGLPRARFAALPTPLERAPTLGRRLGREQLLIKRDDLTGLALGGNKVRELELILGDALARGADVFVAGGGVAHSNHARQCAAAARRCGLEIVLVLRRGTRPLTHTGNLLVTQLMEPDIRWADIDPALDDRESLSPKMDEVAEELRATGHTPYVLYSSFHPLAAAAYVAAGLEIAAQLRERGMSRARIYCTSMGATHVGLLLAARACGLDWAVVGLGWRPLLPDLRERLSVLSIQTAALLDLDAHLAPADFETVDCGGPEYAVTSPESLDAIRTAAVDEGLLLDPVYSGKGMAGMMGDLGSAAVPPDVPIVFVHTGGLPALFAYADELATAHPRGGS